MHCYPKKRRAKVTLSAQPYHSLESRQMLAGNVLVNYDAVTKNLLLTGDNLNNQVSVVQGPANGLVTITGNNGTTINGSAQMVLPGPYLGNVSSQMSQGNDALTFTNVVLQNYNAQENGNGADRLTMNNVKVKGNVLVNTLGGNDQLKISGDFS